MVPVASSGVPRARRDGSPLSSVHRVARSAREAKSACVGRHRGLCPGLSYVKSNARPAVRLDVRVSAADRTRVTSPEPEAGAAAGRAAVRGVTSVDETVGPWSLQTVRLTSHTPQPQIRTHQMQVDA